MNKFQFRLAVFLVITIFAGFFVLPFGLGVVAKHKYIQLINLASKTNAVKITLLDYKRGWFSSEATLKVDLFTNGEAQKLTTALTKTDQPINNDDNPAQSELIIKQTIQQGPIFSIDNGNGKSLLVGQALISTHIDSQFGVADMFTWIKADGTLFGKIQAPKIAYSIAPAANSLEASRQDLVLNNLSGIFKASADLRRVMGKGYAAQINIKDRQTQQQINEVNVEYNLQKSDSGLYVGQQRYFVGSMSWQSELHDSELSFNGFNVQTYDEEKDRKMSSLMDIELKQVVINNAQYGPQQLSLAINQIDVPALLAAKEKLTSLQQETHTLSLPSLFSQYQQVFLPLLSKGVAVEIKRLNIVTPYGNPSLVANIKFPPQENVDFANVANNANVVAVMEMPATFLIRLIELTSKFNGEDAFLPAEKITQQAQQKITDWTMQKWLLPKGNGYEVNLIYENKHLMINGKPYGEGEAHHTETNLLSKQ